MKILIILAWRNIWRNRRRSIISITSVLFAVMMAIIAQAFIKGTFYQMINNLVKNSTGYIQIQHPAYMDEPSISNGLIYDENFKKNIDFFNEEIEYCIPRIQNPCMLTFNDNSMGSLLMGIDVKSENRFNNLSKSMIEGEYFEENSENVLILAEGFAIKIKAKVGDTLSLLSQNSKGEQIEKSYPVKGIVHLKIPELNNSLIYLPIQSAQNLFEVDNKISTFIIMPKNPEKTTDLSSQIETKLNRKDYVVYTWQTLLSDIIQLMEFKGAGNKSIIFILYVVIAFGLFGTILTMMLERVREYKMLISLGMKRSKLAILSLLETLFLSFTGAVVGMIASLPIITYFHFYPIKLSGDIAKTMLEYGFEPVLPLALQSQIFLNQAYVVFLIAIVTGIYPILKIVRMKTLNNE